MEAEQDAPWGKNISASSNLATPTNNKNSNYGRNDRRMA